VVAARTGRGHRVRRRLQGVAFLSVLLLLLGLTVAIYNKALPWQQADTVTLHATRIGNELTVPADVKLDGVLVGRVSKTATTGSDTTLTLKISKSMISSIPSNVEARILPKTLFGEKFVDLVTPAKPSPKPLASGAVIPQDRSSVAIELQSVFEKLVPVLKTLNPAELSTTLSNVAMALRGRGDELGQNLVLIDKYLSVLNKDLPNIKHDISGLADLASNVADAAPDLLDILRNFSVTAHTFTVKKDDFAQFLLGTSGFATTATNVLHTNGNALIKLAHTSRPVLDTVARYSIVLECLPNGLTIFDQTRLQQAFAGGELHIDLIPVGDRGAYTAAERPTTREFENDTLPPNCYGLPYAGHGLNPKDTPYPFFPSANSDKGGLLGTGGSSNPGNGTNNKSNVTQPDILGSTGGVGSKAEQRTIARLLGEQDNSASSMGLGDLLLGPMLRGMAVTP
jgi:phospholipid/cholesterol/gamma-HCH transport system substrate-binding protein